MTREEILAELRRIASSEKTATGDPTWVGDTAGASPLRRFSTPLAIDGVIYAGVTLRMAAPRAAPPGRPFYDMRALLTATVNGQIYHIGRVEFDPAGEPPHHTNPFSAKDIAPSKVSGPHCHPFAENAQIGLNSFVPASNLPVALPENRQIRRYDDVLELVRDRFVIPGLWTEDPEWLQLLM